MPFILLLTSILCIFSCGKDEKHSTANITFNVGYALVPGRSLRILGIKSGETAPSFVYDTAVPGTNTLTIEVPNGSWNFYSVEWTGTGIYQGELFCGIANSAISLAGTSTNVVINVNQTNCAAPAFNTIFTNNENFCYQPNQSTPNGLFRAGDGSAANPYHICSETQLRAIGSNFTTYSSSHFYLRKNINFFRNSEGELTTDQPVSFNMIGEDRISYPAGSVAYTGTFDGNNHRIIGMNIRFDPNGTVHNEIGFIRNLGQGGLLKNITFVIPDVWFDDDRQLVSKVGVAAGYMKGGLQNVDVLFGHIEGNTRVGGLVGHAYYIDTGSKIQISSTRSTEVRGAGEVGGIVGLFEFPTGNVIYRTYSTGDVEGNEGYCSNNTYDNQNDCTNNSGTWYEATDIGGLAGKISGTCSGADHINQSFSKSWVEGNNNVGGLVGNLGGGCQISNSYSTGSLRVSNSNGCIGGIAGSATVGAPALSYVFHTIGGIRGDSINKKGIVGCENAGNVICTSTYSLLASGCASGSDFTTQTYSSIRSSSTYGSWDLTTTDTALTWYMPDDAGNVPRLSWEFSASPQLSDPCTGKYSSAPFAGGAGTLANPWQICSKTQLQNISSTGHYKLLADIDANSSTSASFLDITFQGNLDGDNHFISNIDIQGAGANSLGFITTVGTSGVVKNLSLDNIQINTTPTPGNNIGGLTALNQGLIENIEIDGDILGDTDVGGVAGVNEGIIRYGESFPTIRGNINTGGLVGRNSGGNIVYSRSHAFIMPSIATSANAANYGGLVGKNETGAIIDESYSRTYIYFPMSFAGSNPQYVGGLVGDNSTLIRNSYAVGEIKGDTNTGSHDPDYVGGLIGTNSGNIQNAYSSITGEAPNGGGVAGKNWDLLVGTGGLGTYSSTVVHIGDSSEWPAGTLTLPTANYIDENSAAAEEISTYTALGWSVSPQMTQYDGSDWFDAPWVLSTDMKRPELMHTFNISEIEAIYLPLIGF